MHDVIIIGGGPAGLTAGIYAARASMKALLVRSAFNPSLITTTDLIENYPGFPDGIGGFELVELFTRQALRFGLEITDDDTSAVSRHDEGGHACWKVQGSSGAHTALSVIVATGTEYAHLGVPGEAEFTGRGVSYCATCDGPFYRGGRVVVVGGGDTAVQEALYLTNFAASVTIVHRRDRLRATAVLQERAKANEKISFAWNAVVEEITGDDAVRAVRLQDVRDPAAKRTLEADGVFIFTGTIPNTGMLKGVADLDNSGYITVDSHMQTSAPGIFACGDCTRKLLRQVVTACGDGATAAFAAYEYVSGLKGTSYGGYTP
ncbi:MAG TPA: thioredoxin-disulfide reductase [Deltaproteobacteria bacterium]|nr:thioredoxin-disulfide reductase [Deltaproteobacteria bacterium]